MNWKYKMNEEKFIQLNVAFRIPEDVAKVAIELSREIAEKEDAYFVLDGVEYFPHISNYYIDVLESEIGKICEEMEEIVKNFSPVEFTYSFKRANDGWVMVFFENTDEVMKLHEAIVGRISKKFFKRSVKIEGERLMDHQIENIEKFGKPTVMDLYEPHLTFTRLKDIKIAEKVTKELTWKIKKFTSDKIGVFVSGEHGTCRKLIQEFRLGRE